jgi:phage terminase small subunit
MSDSLKDILGNSNKDIDNQTLMDYLSHRLSKQDSHDIEKMMTDDDLLNDAVEGLEQFKSKKDMAAYVEQLNNDLQKKIIKKKSRKEKRKLKEQPWVYFVLITLLILLVTCFILVKKYLE